MWLNILYLNRKTGKTREFNIHCPKINCGFSKLNVKETNFILAVVEFYRCLNETAKDFNLTKTIGYKKN